MAEKRKKMFNKKWIVAISILALIAIVVTTVLLLLPKNTRLVVTKMYEHEKVLFLKDKTEDDLLKSFEGKIDGVDTKYYLEAKNVRVMTANIEDMVKFYNDYLYYTSDNGTFQDYYGSVIKGIDHAEQYKLKMVDLLKDIHEKLQDQSVTNLRTAWREYRKLFVEYLKGYHQAFVGLGHVYKACLVDGITQNNYTYYLIDVTNSLFENIIKDYQVCVEADEKEQSYSFGSGKVNKLSSITNLLSDKTQLTKYNYSSSMQEQIKLVDKFQEVYNVGIDKVVDSIDINGNITFNAVSQDTNSQLLNAVKNLINGGIRA